MTPRISLFILRGLANGDDEPEAQYLQDPTRFAAATAIVKPTHEIQGTFEEGIDPFMDPD